MPTDQAVILYGPPASGKDTVTAALAEHDDRYKLFRRLKCGPGRTDGYRMVSALQLAAARATGDVVWENRRYGASYVVDRPEVDRMLGQGEIPVMHMGQPGGVTAILDALPRVDILVVALDCPRGVARQRIEDRHTGDASARLAAWDATPRLGLADVRVDTSTVSASKAAAVIHRALLAGGSRLRA